MLYRQHPLLNKSLSAIGFGGAALSGEGAGYGFGSMSELESETLLKAAWEAGINLFDTAPIYGFGLSEERMGRYLPREAFIVTKGGVDWHSNKRVNMSNDPVVIERMLLESLKRLKREQIDLYMIHWPDSKVDIRRPLEILRKYQDKNFIKYIGLCNSHQEDLSRAKEVISVVALQSELNLLSTKAFDQFEDQWKNYFSMAWGTLDKGILSGRVHQKRTFDKEDCRSWAPWWNKKEVSEKIKKVEMLQSILQDYNITLTQFCLHFNLSAYGVSSTLVGSKSAKDLVEMISHLQKPIPKRIIEEVIKRWEC